MKSVQDVGVQDAVAPAQTVFNDLMSGGFAEEYTMPGEGQKRVADGGIMRGVLQVVAACCGAQRPCRQQTVTSAAVLRDCGLRARSIEGDALPREWENGVANGCVSA